MLLSAAERTAPVTKGLDTATELGVVLLLGIVAGSVTGKDVGTKGWGVARTISHVEECEDGWV